MPNVMADPEPIVKEHLFRFGLTDPMPFIALPFVAIIPLKSEDPFKVDHLVTFVVYACNVQRDSA